MNTNTFKNILLVLIGVILVGGAAGYIYITQTNKEVEPVSISEQNITDKTNTEENKIDVKSPAISKNTIAVALREFGIEFMIPENSEVGRNNYFNPLKGVGDVGYSLSGDFSFTGIDSYGPFSYTIPYMGYLINSDDYDDGGGACGGPCGQGRNTTKEEIRLSGGLKAYYEYGGERLYSDVMDPEFHPSPDYAEATIKINKSYLNTHFSEIHFVNYRLPEKEFRKIIESIKPL